MIDGRARTHRDTKSMETGPTLVMVPGSCSTGAAWRPVMKTLDGNFRFVTTSLLGYGETAERRAGADPSVSVRSRNAWRRVIRKAGRECPPRRSFVRRCSGARGRPAQTCADRQPDDTRGAAAFAAARSAARKSTTRSFRDMTDAYFAAYRGGDREAIANDDRLLRRRGDLSLVAGARTRLRRGDDAGQRARLGDPPMTTGCRRKFWQRSSVPVAVAVGREKPSCGLQRQRSRRYVDQGRDVQDDRRRIAFHDLDPSRHRSPT